MDKNMHIVVCVKQVPDIKAPIETNEEGTGIIEEEAYYITNRPDKVAVEEAVRIKEKLGEGEVVLVALGSARVERALRDCLTLGADRAIMLTNFDFNEADAYVSAEILAGALEIIKPDLILCGSFAEDTQYGKVGIMIAEILGIPSVSNVDKIDVIENGKVVSVHRKLERGNREIIRCPLPAVVTIDPGANNPRYASLPTYMEALALTIEQWDPVTVSFRREKPRLKVTSLTLPRPRTKKGIIIDSSLTPEERIKILVSGGVSQRESNIIDGTPEEIADKLVKYLISNNIIKQTSEGEIKGT